MSARPAAGDDLTMAVAVAVASTRWFRAECVLVRAMNPFPCGFKGLPEEQCVRISICERQGDKISSPFRGRIDIHLDVPRLKPEELPGMQPGSVRR